jgi:hypothetical protein
MAQNRDFIRSPEMPALAQTPTVSDIRQAIVRTLIENVDNPSVSISEAASTVRGIFPLCGLTDWELGDLIARNAIDAGFAIEFDMADP